MPSLLLCSTGGAPPAASWSEFDSTNAATYWYVESNAIDGNDATYSTGSGADYSEYLVLTLTSAKTACTAIKLLVARDPILNANSTLLVEKSTNGSDWTTLVDGSSTPIQNATVNGWQNYNFASQDIKAIRFKRQDDTAEYVYGAQVYGV